MPRPPRFTIVLLIALAHVLGASLAQGTTPAAAASEAYPHDHADDAHHDGDPHDHADDARHDDAHHDDARHDDAHHNQDRRDHDDHDGGDLHHAGLEGVRLLVASLDGPEMIVLDAADGDVVGRFTVPGLGRVVQLPNPQLAGVLHRDADRVSFVHSGLTAIDHGDHGDLVVGWPYVLQTVNLGPRPAQLFAMGHDIAVYNDGDGSMVWLDARLLGISLDVRSVDGRAADPGSVAVVDGHLIGGGQREAAVHVYDRNATRLATFEGCPGLEGQAAQPSRAVFGCSDGVLIVEAIGGGVFAAHKIVHPAGTPDGARVGTLASDAGSPIVAGDFGRGIALVDPAVRTLTPIALPAAPAGMAFAEDGAVLVVLTLDGWLRALDPRSGELHASVEVLEGWTQGEPRPSLALLGDHAFVLDPRHAAVWVVDLDGLEVATHHDLPFTPGSIAVMALPGAVGH